MASYKGKYPGPDVFKGDKKKIAAWKKAGKPKLAGAKSKTPIWDKAEKLGESKYASALEAINQQRESNRSMYDSATGQRVSALDREMGSISAAGATTNKQLEDLKGATATSYQQALAQSQQNSAATQAARNQANSSMLSSLEAEAKARGLSSGTGGQATELATRLGSQDSTMSAVAEMNKGALERTGEIAKDSLTMAQGSASMLTGSAKSGARGDAQRALDTMYQTYLAERNQLAGTEATTKLDMNDYINQTYLTLKEKKAAEKAAEAQAKLQAQIAQGELNYKNTKLQTDTQYKYDKLASDTAQKDIANKLKAQGFSHKKAMDLANLLLKKNKGQMDLDKWNWKKANPDSSATTNLSDLIASLQ
jgi:hypothetical protein